jgi:hypothetical protein
MKSDKYSDFFQNDPWSALDSLCYPEGRRLYLNDERFWVSADLDKKIMLFVHEIGEINLKVLENIDKLEITIDRSFAGATRLCCTLVEDDCDLKDKFSIVAKDIAYSCSKFSGNELLTNVQLRIKSWASFLKPSRTGLTNSEYVGFWGELYIFYQYLLKLHSAKNAVRFWLGPEGKKQDITLNSVAIEIKTSMSGDSQTIKISSIDQLEKITPSLFLIHLIASPSVDEYGFSLLELYELSLRKVQYDTEIETYFLNKVSKLFGKANNEQLNSSISIISENMFSITEDFPVLRRKDIPLAINNVNYEIQLSEINKFKSDLSIEEVIKNG